jgi:hypothetical protein
MLTTKTIDARMSAERSSTSHATAWTLALLAAPVIYVLTLPIVVWGWSMTARSTRPPPAWLQAYVAPAEWLTKTPLKKPMEMYFAWTFDHLRALGRP